VTDLSGARVLITGGAGVVGSTIVDALVPTDPAEIVVLDNFSRGLGENLASAKDRAPLNVVVGDVRDRDLVASVMRGIDVVFHQAAIRLPHCVAEPRLALEVMVDGTFNVVEAAQAAGVRKLVAASSVSIYGSATRFPTAEAHDPYGNRTIYGAAKTFSEGLLRSFNEVYGFDYVALRYFNVYGPRMDAHTAYTEVLVRWMQRINDRQPPIVDGAGNQTMDFVYVDDVARANLLAATSDVTDDVFNVASGVETSLDELAHALLTAMGSDLAVEYGPARAVPAVERRLADTEKARKVLGFEAEVDLSEGLAQLVDWWRARCAR
jgi:nucleoside-diphosphate-sugar epimerase